MVQRPSTWRNRDAAPFAPAVPVLAWARSDAPPLAKGGRLWARAPYSTTVTQVARTGCREVRHSRWRMAQMESTPTSTSCFGSKGGSVVRSARQSASRPNRTRCGDFRRRVLAVQRRVGRPSRPSVRPQVPVEREEFIVHGDCLHGARRRALREKSGKLRVVDAAAAWLAPLMMIGDMTGGRWRARSSGEALSIS